MVKVKIKGNNLEKKENENKSMKVDLSHKMNLPNSFLAK